MGRRRSLPQPRRAPGSQQPNSDRRCPGRTQAHRTSRPAEGQAANGPRLANAVVRELELARLNKPGAGPRPSPVDTRSAGRPGHSRTGSRASAQPGRPPTSRPPRLRARRLPVVRAHPPPRPPQHARSPPGGPDPCSQGRTLTRTTKVSDMSVRPALCSLTPNLACHRQIPRKGGPRSGCAAKGDPPSSTYT